MINPEDIAKLDQAHAALSDMLPSYWRRLYQNSIAAGFSEIQSMDLLKTYILAQGIKYEK